MSVAVAMLGAMDEKSDRKLSLLSGIATTAELRSLGNSVEQIRRLARSGSLIPLRQGVYVRAQAARTILQQTDGDLLLRAAAALAVTGHDAVASHQTAALLHKISLLDERRSQVMLTARTEGGRRGRTGILLRTADLPRDHVTVALGLPLTTPARTVIDLARTLNFRSGVTAADSALHLKLTTKDELRAVIAACARWPGLRRAINVVAFADSLAESPLESVARVVFMECGLPRPELQVWLGGRTEPVGRVDFYWKEYWTAAEVDGAMKYRDPIRAKAQLRRDSELRAEGFEVVHFDWHDITENPYRVAALIRQAFARGKRTAAARARKAAARLNRAGPGPAPPTTTKPTRPPAPPAGPAPTKPASLASRPQVGAGT
jgi:Transcriptional regulator, AbiEi antitoxin/Protein of unknown function (DUF559)